MPQYLRDHPVYYAGPAKTPEGYASGSFGPTTAGRMDSYVDQFQAAGGSLVMLAKGNRSSRSPTPASAHGGFYLGSIGGPAARLAQDCIRKVEVLEYPELGMEAVWRIEVEDFPAFIVVDDKGNDFFAESVVDVGVSDRKAVMRGWRAPGTHLPKAMTAGTFRAHGEKDLWMVGPAKEVLVIELTGEEYRHLIVQVEDPHAAVEALKAAMRRER
jgi:tartrate/fumarate subfamily iron-sulfur-dependent hydro-lyase beta chain